MPQTGRFFDLMVLSPFVGAILPDNPARNATPSPQNYQFALPFYVLLLELVRPANSITHIMRGLDAYFFADLIEALNFSTLSTVQNVQNRKFGLI